MVGQPVIFLVGEIMVGESIRVAPGPVVGAVVGPLFDLLNLPSDQVFVN